MSAGGGSGLKGACRCTGGGNPDRPEGSITGGNPICAEPESVIRGLRDRAVCSRSLRSKPVEVRLVPDRSMLTLSHRAHTHPFMCSAGL